ncbi:MAG: hypothetical protein A2W25_13320 [candidate division Zixibacteria bacterium RBG_16_53_22]|nr:MAG: hypothetical protein A2W25_13320 [candidate division Zixibacteria bacterium RBG_16_53_22]
MFCRIFVLVVGLLSIYVNNATSQAPPDGNQRGAVIRSLSSLPLAFTQNLGQWDDITLFQAQTGGATFAFHRDGVLYALSAKQGNLFLAAQFVGSSPEVEVAGEERLGHNSNYFIGNDPACWRTGVPNYSSVIYRDLYPGIDLRYHGDDGALKYDFIVAPGAEYSRIEIRYSGAIGVEVTDAGDLEINSQTGPVYEKKPYVYQEIDGATVEISGRYMISGHNSFRFDLEAFNPNYQLVIDPHLVFSSYFGGINDDMGLAVAVDANNCVYLAGRTDSDEDNEEFPILDPDPPSFRPSQLHYNGGECDAFVAKFCPNQSGVLEMVYCSYLGGVYTDSANGITVDAFGKVWVTGLTNSDNFPTVSATDYTLNDDDPSNYRSDAFVAKLDEDGDIVFSTYYGGPEDDEGADIAVDKTVSIAFVTGWTVSPPDIYPYDDTGFPITQNAFDATLNDGNPGPPDAFMGRFSAGALEYSTYLGGSDWDKGYGIAVQVVGYSRYAFLTGETYSAEHPGQETGFPLRNAIDLVNGGAEKDAFVTKFNAIPSTLQFSTYLGGSNYETGYDIAVDSDGRAYVTGGTNSADFVIVGGFDNQLNNGPGDYDNDAFIAKYTYTDPILSLVYSSYLGGGSHEEGFGIAIDAQGIAYITGETASNDFPLVNNDDDFVREWEVFVTKVGYTGGGLIYSTYLSGDEYNDFLDSGHDIAVNGTKAYAIGFTDNPLFPLVNPLYGNHGNFEAFFARFEPLICHYIAGDSNGDGIVSGADVAYNTNYFKGWGPPPPIHCDCPPHNMLLDPGPPQVWGLYAGGDANGNCVYNGVDNTYLVNYFKGVGPAPKSCLDCLPTP